MRNRTLRWFRLIGLTLLAAGWAAPAGFAADSVAQFYKGKTVAVVIGSAPAAGFDTYGRLVARHLGRFIPGNPNLVAQNMPGAGGSNAGRYIAGPVPQDGTFVGAIHPATVMAPILGSGGGKTVEPIKFHYLGSANSDVEVCIVRSDAPVKRFEDVFTTEIVIGAASDAASTREFATLLKNLLGAKFKIVAGYTGNREIFLAMQRGEVQGACGVSWSGLSATQGEWLKSGAVVVIAQEAVTGHPELDRRGIPLTTKFASPEQKEVLDLFYSQLIFGRPYVVGPGVPKERVEALRAAFAAMLKDQEFLADAAKIGLEIELVPGAELQTIVDKIYGSAPDNVAKLRKALEYGG
jgi:tripartite-type tricarboxylate transporter receptor subunit TctC